MSRTASAKKPPRKPAAAKSAPAPDPLAVTAAALGWSAPAPEPDTLRVEVRAFRVHRECPTCGNELLPDGTMTTGHPPRYAHRCAANADHGVFMFDRAYPVIEHETVGAAARTQVPRP